MQFQEGAETRNNIDFGVYVAPSIVIRLHIIFQVEINDLADMLRVAISIRCRFF